MADWAFTDATGVHDYVGHLDIDLTGQSTSGNYSDLSWTMYVTGTWGAFGNYSTTWYANVGGAKSGTLGSFSGSRIQLASGTARVYHNADGTKSLTVTGSWDSKHGSIGAFSISKSITLPTIPRASQPSVSGAVDAGQTMTIYTNRASSSFTHTLKYSYGSASGTIATGVGASYAWAVPMSLLNEIPTKTSGTGTITCDTYSGSTKIGTKTVGFTVKAGSGVVPTIASLLVSEGNPAVTIGAFVQGESKLSLDVDCDGVYGSVITSKVVTVDGQSITCPGTSAPIKGSGSLTVTATVTDSRGRTATKSGTVTVLAYTPPKLTGVTFRRALTDGTPNEDGTAVRVDGVATTTSLKVGGVEKNTLTLTLEADSGSGWYQIASWSGAVPSATVAKWGDTVPVTESRVVRLTAQDKLHTTLLAGVISTQQVTLTLAQLGIGVGKVWEQGTVDAADRMYQRNGNTVLDDGDTIPNSMLTGISMGLKVLDGPPAPIGNDLNNATATGFYTSVGGTTLHSPDSSLWFNVIVSNAGSRSTQIAYPIERAGVVYKRWRLAPATPVVWSPWVAITNETVDDGWTNLQSYLGPGMSYVADGATDLAGVRARRVGLMVELSMGNIQVASMSVPVTGNIANQAMLVNIPTRFRPLNGAAINPGWAGRIWSGYVNPAGSVYIAAVVPDANATGTVTWTNETFSGTATYPAATP